MLFERVLTCVRDRPPGIALVATRCPRPSPRWTRDPFPARSGLVPGIHAGGSGPHTRIGTRLCSAFVHSLVPSWSLNACNVLEGDSAAEGKAVGVQGALRLGAWAGRAGKPVVNSGRMAEMNWIEECLGRRKRILGRWRRECKGPV